jgi:ketosteroid isomerase-like protein
MSPENLNLVRSIFTAFEQGDFTRAPEWAHPDIEYVVVDGPSPGSWMGLAGVAEGSYNLLRAGENVRLEADEYRELDDERVLVLTLVRGRGKASGLDVGQLRTRMAQLFHVRSSKITRLVVWIDGERALADLGFAPEDDAARS